MSQVKRILPRVEEKRLRVAAYCRVSSDSRDQLNSYEVQKHVYTRMIEQREEWQLVGIFADEGISGMSTDKRDSFLEMIRLCEIGKIDLVITKSMSRFARNVKESLEYIRKLRHIGVGIYFEKEGLNTLYQGDEMLLNVFSAIAQEESKSISQNLKLSIRKRMELGEFVDSNAPYGYRLDEKKLKVYEPEAEIVRLVFQLFVNGWSTSEIARELDKRHVPTRYHGKKWISNRIAYILVNERYVGDCLYQKSYSEEIVPFKQNRNQGEKTQIYVTETHPQIVDRRTFEIAGELLKKKQKKFESKGIRQEYILSNLMICSKCKSKYIRRLVNGEAKWGCSKHIQDKNYCSSIYYTEKELCETLGTIINKLRFGSIDLLEWLISQLELLLTEYKKNNPIAKKRIAEREELNSKLYLLAELQSRGYIEADMYQAQVLEVNRSLEKNKHDGQDEFETGTRKRIDEAKHLRERIMKLKEPVFKSEIEQYIDCIETIEIYNGMMKVRILNGIELYETIGV